MFIGNSIGIGNDSSESATSVANAFVSRVEADGGVVESKSCLVSRIQTLRDRNLWNLASAVWLPHGYKEGKLYAAKGGATADFGFSRAGTRTRKGATYVEEVPYNLLQSSEDITSGAWTKDGGVGTTANAITAPDGTLSGDKLYESTTVSGQKRAYQSIAVRGGNYRYTVWAKAGERNWLIVNPQSSAPANTYFNLSDGTIGTNAAGNTASIESLGDGWYKCSVTRSTAAAGNVAVVGIASADGVDSYAGVVNSGLYIWRQQKVVGTVERDYFKTTNRQHVPALDYTGSTCPAWSLDKASTNLLLQSEAFDNASWTKNGTTVSANAVAGPENLTTADNILETTAAAPHELYQSITKSAASLAYSATIYAKPINGRNWLAIKSASGANAVTKYFDVSTGTLGNSVVEGTGWAITNASIKLMANGFYRCELNYTSGAEASLAVAYQIASANGTNSFAGDVTKGLSYYGAQLEQSSYATSYIATTTATVSRIADAVPALTGVSSLIGQTEGTLYFEGSSFADGTPKNPIELNDNTGNNRIVIQFTTTNVIRAYIATGGVQQALIDNAGFISETNYKCAFTYKNNKAAFFINGVKLGEDLTVSVPACSAFMLKSSAGDQIFDGNGKTWAISKTAISDAQAISLTTP